MNFTGDKNSTHNMLKLSLGFSHHYLHLLGSSHNHNESESYTTYNQPNHSAPEVIKYIYRQKKIILIFISSHVQLLLTF